MTDRRSTQAFAPPVVDDQTKYGERIVALEEECKVLREALRRLVLDISRGADLKNTAGLILIAL